MPQELKDTCAFIEDLLGENAWQAKLQKKLKADNMGCLLWVACACNMELRCVKLNPTYLSTNHVGAKMAQMYQSLVWHLSQLLAPILVVQLRNFKERINGNFFKSVWQQR